MVSVIYYKFSLPKVRGLSSPTLSAAVDNVPYTHFITTTTRLANSYYYDKLKSVKGGYGTVAAITYSQTSDKTQRIGDRHLQRLHHAIVHYHAYW